MKFTHLFKGATLAVMATLALTGCGNVTKNQNEDVKGSSSILFLPKMDISLLEQLKMKEEKKLKDY